MRTARTFTVAVVAVLAVATLMCEGASTPQRRITEGAMTPEFSAADTTGKPFAYTQSGGKVLMLAFLSSEKKRSQGAAKDIFGLLSSVPPAKMASLQVAFVMQDVNNKEFIASIQKEAPSVVHILDDEQHDIWGKFGVIATPTVLVSDPNGKVLCVKPGRTYDFAAVVKSRLFQALEIPYDVSPEAGTAVRTVANTTMSAKARRHLQMAKSLAKKGRVSSAIDQAQIAQEIDPNLPEVALELAELLCRAGRAQKAIELVSKLSVQNRRDKARANLALGWANRQMGKLEEAEKFLLEGIRQDATLHRLFFELGRIYQKRNDAEKAMQAYFRALQLIYGED
ncbi:MAG: tetratricopeptide repeat protein [Phycisphaerales bacterium]|nr:MAG: tetratricopeptide repeat protein [Phycisphaerales bacterium]